MHITNARSLVGDARILPRSGGCRISYTSVVAVLLMALWLLVFAVYIIEEKELGFATGLLLHPCEQFGGGRLSDSRDLRFSAVRSQRYMRSYVWKALTAGRCRRAAGGIIV